MRFDVQCFIYLSHLQTELDFTQTESAQMYELYQQHLIYQAHLLIRTSCQTDRKLRDVRFVVQGFIYLAHIPTELDFRRRDVGPTGYTCNVLFMKLIYSTELATN